MTVEPFRRDVAALTKAEIPERLNTYVYETSLLARLAHTHGLRVVFDLVERDTYTEIVVSVRDAD